MTANQNRPMFLWLTVPLASLVVVAGYGGLFWPSIYAHENLISVAQARGFDVANIFVAAPILVVSAVLASRNSIAARLVWLGTLLFLLYGFVIYALEVHFNRLFLAYCAVFGLSFWSVLAGLRSIPVAQAEARYSPRAPVKTTAVLFLLIAVFFAAQWLREIVPALLSGVAPKSVTEAGGRTNPVHFLDLSMALPAYVHVGIAAWRRKPEAYVWAPILMVLGIVMFVAIAFMMISMGRMGLPMETGQVAVIFAAAAAFTVLLARFLR